MNDFQKMAIGTLAEALAKAGKAPLEFTRVRGRKEEFLLAKGLHAGKGLEVYIYDNEAGYMSGGTRWTIFERPDYENDGELIQSFVAGLLKVLD